MRVTPLDIIKKEFAPARRNGIDKEEVDSFLSDVRDTLDELIKENQRLRDMIARRDAEIAQLRGEESSIKDTLILARRLTEDLERNARREADLIIGDARLEAQKILMTTADERRNLQVEIAQLQSSKTRLCAEMRAILISHSSMLDKFEEEQD
jgi:cell division initiation protein